MQAHVFAALADPTRLSIVEMLASKGRMSVKGISSQYAMSAPAISQHLKILREAGLVHVETRAQQRIYAINQTRITEMERWIDHMRKLWTQRLDALDELLKEEMRAANQSSTPSSTEPLP
ncbi:MAG: helix-turn-helix transcriptional regulator ['Candidatus Kapabacteria' thiocyanatum]|uniref:HTH arsR-type domain-containing protein n=1 Tax=Candidatus Kapaibacterium thiocyanatum TaxID=1895771 RepID=A0A1M3KZB7_9BACT|nr:helix-turn-helix transcriptional regulator ['Candidatus Kapabacteria' thiocyanatum]OJX57833.1 MAG: hypothetical protein BGO89_07640 ['Candidatus Kapabacteria' thiocyanatum]